MRLQRRSGTLLAVTAIAADRSQRVNVNEEKPAAYNGITLTGLVTGSGTFNGTAAAELVLGSSGVDTINARGGNDCVGGGAGNDSINGGAGTDVCIGRPGTDTFTNCETQIQ